MTDSVELPVGQLVGQDESLTRALQAAADQTLHHGVVIAGPRGVGKSTVATLLAEALLQTGQGSGRDLANHPDYHLVQPPPEREDIPVDELRDLLDSLQRLAVEGGARVVVFDPADRLNQQGQNALLKTLEEPGRRTWLLLPTSRPEALLETVRSRVSEIRLRPLSDAQVRGLLPEADSDRVDLAVAVARGSVGLALKVVEADLESFLGLWGSLLDRRLEPSPVALAKAALLGVSGSSATRDRGRLVLRVLAEGLENLRPERGKNGGERGGEPTYSLADDALAAYPAAACERWADLCEKLFLAEEDLDLRIPPEQVLTALFQGVCSGISAGAS